MDQMGRTHLTHLAAFNFEQNSALVTLIIHAGNAHLGCITCGQHEFPWFFVLVAHKHVEMKSALKKIRHLSSDNNV